MVRRRAPTRWPAPLWRLYLLRSWVYADPQTAAIEFDRGRPHVPVAEVDLRRGRAPGPDEVRALVDEVLGGVVVGDFADTLFRASAFARVAAAGRVHRDPRRRSSGSSYASDVSASRLLTLADQLERAAHLELDRRAWADRQSARNCEPSACRVVPAPDRGSPGSQIKPLRAATRREALPVRRTNFFRRGGA